MRPSLRSSGPQTDPCPPQGPCALPQVSCVSVYMQERVSSRPMCVCPLPLSAALMTLAEESDDKCPLSANEADDKWAGARAAPLRCNNRRWMAWRPPPHPHPAAPVTGADPAPPAGEGAALRPRPAAANPGRRRRPSPKPGDHAAARGGGTKRRAQRAQGAHGASRLPGHAAVHTHGRHTRQPPVSLHGAPAALVQAQPQPRKARHTGVLYCLAQAYVCHMDLGIQLPA